MFNTSQTENKFLDDTFETGSAFSDEVSFIIPSQKKKSSLFNKLFCCFGFFGNKKSKTESYQPVSNIEFNL